MLIYEEFKADNEETVRLVMHFLGVDDSSPISSTTANPTVRVRSQGLNHLLHAVSVGRGPISLAIKGSIKSVTPRRARRRAVAIAEKRLVFRAPLPPDEDLMLELRHRFKGEVVAVSEFLGRDLVTFWGYDRID